MKKRVLAGLLIAIMCLTMLPATAFAADGACDYCQSTGGHTVNCVYSCPTDNCKVTKQMAEGETVTYSHSQTECPYAKDPTLFCEECGYWVYRDDEDDYWHRTGCSIGYPQSDETVGEDDSPDATKTDFSNINGVSYYGVNSKNFDTSTALYIKDMLTAQTTRLKHSGLARPNQSISSLWQYVAQELQDEYGRGTKEGKFKTQFDNVMSWPLATRTGSSGTYEQSISNGDNTYKVYSTGLTEETYAGSVSAAAADMETQIFNWYRANGGGRDDKYAGDPSDGAVRKNTTLSSDTDPDNVYYMLTGAFKTSGKNKKGHYQALGVIFSDPTITAILPADDGSATTSTESEPTMGTQVEASHVKNETNTTISAQQELTTTTSYEATSEINGSRQYGFEETVAAGYERDGILSGKISVEVSFTASQVIENGWSQSQSTAEEKSVAYSAGVELPPYTNVMIRQYGSKTTETTEYTCPVALNFTVTVVEYTVDPSDNNATCETRILGTFGANARVDLNKRAIVESALKDSDGITWNDLYEDNNNLKIAVQLLSKNAPMATTGAKFVVVTNTTSSEITGLSPTLPLNRVKTIDDVQDYDLSTGDFLYVDNIQLEGLNAQNAPYYGFNQYLGHWTLVDENGQNLPEDSAVAQLVTDPITKTTRLVAGTQTGTVYLKYLIGNDSKYNTASNPNVYATDDTLAATAVVRVNISDTTLAGGSVAVSGNLAIPVGDSSEAIESYLKTAIYDAEGKKVSRPVIWDQQELASDGITVANNKISFTKEGTFHVRAIVGTGANQIKSDWYEVTALPARALNSIVIPDTAAFDRNGSSLDLSTLTVQYFDQYGDAWTSTTADDLTWVCDNEGAVIKDNVLTVSSAGTYVVTAQTEDGIISNEMNVTVTDSAVTITEMRAEKTSLTSSGGEVEFTITGANLPEGGITLTVQENNSITATTTGTDTEQKATLTFPANTDTSADVTYTVTNNQDDTKTVTITVAKASGSTGGGSTGGGSTGGSSGGSSSSTTYVPSVDAGHNGDVTVSPSRPSSGQTVTITVDPDAGYELDDLTVTDARGNVVKVTDNGDGTYSFTQPSSKVTIKATFAEIQDEPTLAFVDVPESDYYYDAVLWAVENGVTNGTSATTFSPDADVSRAQMVTFLWRAAGSPEPQSSVNPFTDVSSSAYYYDAVLWAVENGITNGTSGTTFSPESAVSRAQAVTFLWRSASSPAASGVSFDDVADEAYYAQAVAWAAQAGITNGTGGNNFSPDLIVSRAQAVTFLYRHMG